MSNAIINQEKNSAEFTWNELFSEHGGSHPIKISLKVSLQSSQAVYVLRIENKSEFVVENIYCPVLGDVALPDGNKTLNFLIHFYNSFTELPVWPVYQNNMAYFGVNHPGQMAISEHVAGAPMTPFALLQGEKQGIYIGSLSHGYDFVAWMTELLPGYASATDARFPTQQEIGRRDVSLRLEAVHLPFILPGESRTLSPIAIEPYQGDWHKGADIYKNWRNSWMKTAPVPAWAKEPYSWQQIQINSSEDEYWFPYSELVDIGNECARNGVKAIQLTGWNAGGQDRGLPAHDADPRLGGTIALKKAIRDIQRLGVKVILFMKFYAADRSTEQYRTELSRYAIRDMYGDIEVHRGYSYQSASQRLNISVRRLVPMCFSCKEYLEICVEEFKKAVELGADGILFDECSWHAPALFCFAADHGHPYGVMAFENDNKLIELFREVLAEKSRDFIFAGEACYDWQFQQYNMSYIRTENIRHYPLTRYFHPGMPIMTAAIGFNDRNMINQCLIPFFDLQPLKPACRLESH